MLHWSAYPFLRYLPAFCAGLVLSISGFLSGQILIAVFLVSIFSMGISYVAFFLYRNSCLHTITGISGLLALSCLGSIAVDLRMLSRDPNHLLYVDGPVEAYTAIVDSNIEERTKTYRIQVRLQHVRTRHTWRPATGRIITYVAKSITKIPQYGDVWLVVGAPRLVDAPLNPGEFNYKRYLANRQIHHQQYLKPHQVIVIDHRPPSCLVAISHQINRWADSVFVSNLGNNQEFAVVKAMVLGGQDAIDRDLQEAYSVAGAVHVLSVSGLHVGVLFGVLSFLIGSIRSRLIGKYAFMVIMLLVLWFYALVTGFSAPVLRSAVMFSLVLIGQTIERRHHPLNTLAASAFLILVFDPYALTTVGFQLSYLAVAGLAIWQRPFYQAITVSSRMVNWLWKSTTVALVAQMATFPLCVYYFHQFPVYFWLVNPIIIPLSSAVLISGMGLLVLSWLPIIGHWIGALVYVLMWLLNQCVRLTEQLPFSAIRNLSLTRLELTLVYITILMGLLLIGTRKRQYSFPLLISSLILFFLCLQTTWFRQHQRAFIVHFVPHQSILSIVDGRLTYLYSSKTLFPNNKEVDFYIKNTWDSLGVNQVRMISEKNVRRTIPEFQWNGYSIRVWCGKVIVTIKGESDLPYRPLPFLIDYLIVSHNSLNNWAQLQGRLVAKQVILDDSNRTEQSDRLLKEAVAWGIDCHSVRRQGARLIFL